MCQPDKQDFFILFLWLPTVSAVRLLLYTLIKLRGFQQNKKCCPDTFFFFFFTNAIILIWYSICDRFLFYQLVESLMCQPDRVPQLLYRMILLKVLTGWFQLITFSADFVISLDFDTLLWLLIGWGCQWHSWPLGVSVASHFEEVNATCVSRQACAPKLINASFSVICKPPRFLNLPDAALLCNLWPVRNKSCFVFLTCYKF